MPQDIQLDASPKSARAVSRLLERLDFRGCILTKSRQNRHYYWSGEAGSICELFYETMIYYHDLRLPEVPLRFLLEDFLEKANDSLAITLPITHEPKWANQLDRLRCLLDRKESN